MLINKGRKIKGFTLIELLIYIGILGIVLFLITNFFWNITLGYIKENSYQEIQQNGRFVLTKITQEIRNAKAINYPLLVDSGDYLSLEGMDSEIIFRKEDNKIIMMKNNNSFDLTSDRTVVQNIQFINLSYEDDENNSGIVKIELELNHLNPNSINTYDANIKLTTSAITNI